MIDYLTHYYKRGTEPFRSLSALPDEEAIEIMEETLPLTLKRKYGIMNRLWK